MDNKKLAEKIIREVNSGSYVPDLTNNELIKIAKAVLKLEGVNSHLRLVEKVMDARINDLEIDLSIEREGTIKMQKVFSERIDLCWAKLEKAKETLKDCIKTFEASNNWLPIELSAQEDKQNAPTTKDSGKES